ncbi:MFS transporter [Sphingomonas morindae]|uniref:MFS transporter n=1 Tax=Sphingomonas morindae TaxID=1541170 RepID=A0ABY4X4Z5_9SPHN|nr:MFS transporter [Sphingomonas morindae]USI71926.1 MFS transporter [Sphingomonas morindae]
MSADAARAGLGRYRWTICALLFAATAINYIDRQMIGVLKPVLQVEFGWREGDYADIVFWFQAAYALGFLAVGRFMDAVGARFGYAIAFGFWTAAHIAHGLVRSLFGFGVARFALGIGESGNFPAGLKAVAEWFPQRERALAVGIFNAGANVGAIATPLLVPAITAAFGWRLAFILTGVIGLVWVAAWLLLYRSPAAPMGGAEPAAPALPWLRLFRVRQSWAYAVPKFMTDPIWWMFLFWLPDFLSKRYGLDLRGFGPPLVVIYILSDLGSIAGGAGSSWLVRRGYSVNRARKLTMLACAVAVMPIAIVQHIDSLWGAVLLIGLATAGHQAFSANLLTVPSDLFPRHALGSVVGIGGTAGAIGGMLIAKFVGYVLDMTGSYTPIFAVAASAYLLALAALHLLSPRLAPADLPSGEAL